MIAHALAASSCVRCLCCCGSGAAVAGPPTCRAFGGRTSPPANGLPDNHVFQRLRGRRPRVGGHRKRAGLYENGKWKVFTHRRWPGASRRALRRRGQAHARRLGRHHGRPEPLSPPAASIPTRSSTAAWRTTWCMASPYRAISCGSPPPRAPPPEHAHRRVEPFQRAQHAHVRDLDLRRAPRRDKVYYAVWGGGVLEYDVKTDRWKDYNDPDGETEMVLYKDQGLIHEITTSVS